MTETGLDVEQPDEYLQCEWVPRNAIEPNDWNPNELPDSERAMLKSSIENHGWTRPIIVHAEERYIIDGEQRWDVAGDEDIAKQASLTPPDVPSGYVPIFGLTMDEQKARISTVQHNRARGWADYDSLADFLQEFQQKGLFEELREEIEVRQGSLERIVNEETAPGAIGGPAEVGPPWIPEDVREFDTEETTVDSRTTAMAESDASDAYDRLYWAVTNTERAYLRQLLREGDGAEIFVRLLTWFDEQDDIETLRDVTGAVPDTDEFPHPASDAYDAES